MLIYAEKFCYSQVKETAEIHCGFYSERGGFRISDEDKIYMQNCKFVVSTCAFGGGDDLYQPIGMSEASLRKVSKYDILDLLAYMLTILMHYVPYGFRFAMLHFGMKLPVQLRNQRGIILVMTASLGNGALWL